MARVRVGRPHLSADKQRSRGVRRAGSRMSQPRDANHPQPHMTPEPSQVRPHSIREYKQTPLWATPPGANAPQDPSMAGEDDTILFNGLHEAYGFFSNFAAYPI